MLADPHKTEFLSQRLRRKVGWGNGDYKVIDGMLLRGPIEQPANGFKGKSLSPILGEDGITKFNSVRDKWLKIGRIGPGMEADMANHDARCGQPNPP